MTIVLSDVLTYLHKGIFLDNWKKATFKLCSDGVLYKLVDGNVKRSINLKAVYKYIQIKTAVDCVLIEKQIEGLMAQETDSKTGRLPSIRIFCNRKENDPNFNSLKNSNKIRLISIPFKEGSTKCLTLLFEKIEKFNEWSIGLKRWSCIPEIKIEFVNINLNENEEEDANEIDLNHMIDLNDSPIQIPIKSN